MQLAVVPLQIVAGDSLTLTIRLHTTDGGNRLPLQIAAGEAFVVSLDWAKGRIVSTTSDAFDSDRLALIVGPDKTELVRQFTPAETRRLLGQSVIWSLYRVPAPGDRRTYVTGPVQVIGPGQGAPGDTVLDVSVLEQSIIVDVSVPDAASYTDAREVIIRQDMAAAIADAKKFYAASALLLG